MSCEDLAQKKDTDKIYDFLIDLYTKVVTIIDIVDVQYTPLYKGQAIPPVTPMDYHGYVDLDVDTAGDPPRADRLRDALVKINEQIRNLHIDVCKAIPSKIEPIELPTLSILQLNEETELHEIKTIDPSKKDKKDIDYLAKIYGQDFVNSYYNNAAWTRNSKTKKWVINPRLTKESRKRNILDDKKTNDQLGVSTTIIQEYLTWTTKFIELQSRELLRYQSYITNELKLPLLEYPNLEGCFPAILRDDNGNPVLQQETRAIGQGLERTILTPTLDANNSELEVRRVYNGELPEHINSLLRERMFGEQISKNGRTVRSNLVGLSTWLSTYSRDRAVHQQAQAYITAKSDCLKQPENSDYILLPDPSAVWNTKGNYLLFFWKLDVENPTDKQKTWRHKTQLADPIDELIDPTSPEDVWDEYFANIYQIIGNKWGQYTSKDKTRRYPLYSGWFQSEDEGRRFFESIKSLTKIEGATKSNPSFPNKDNQAVDQENQGVKMVLKKVCIAYKHEDSDKIDFLNGYRPPKKL